MNKQDFFKLVDERPLVIMGAFGTMLQREESLPKEMCPELYNIKYPEIIKKVLKLYIRAGADILQTDTFGGTSIKLADYGLEKRARELNRRGIEVAKEARQEEHATSAHAHMRTKKFRNWPLIGGTMSSMGKLLEPLGELRYEKAYEAFQEQAGALIKAGSDVLIIETMIDLAEALCALRAARAVTTMPILCSMTVTADGNTVTGTPAEAALTCLQTNGADLAGLNCTTGPDELLPIMKRLGGFNFKRLFVQPNGGMPELKDGKTIYHYPADKFGKMMRKMAETGVDIVGACCGTSPEHTAATVKHLKGFKPLQKEIKEETKLASRSKLLNFDGKKFWIVGERINPTGRKKLREEILAGKTEIIVAEAKRQAQEGADVLDINLGASKEMEEKLIKKVLQNVQNITDLPLCIDTTNQTALEIALRNAAGKVLINSVNAEEESLETVLPLAKKYGAAVIGLTLSKTKIPNDPHERYEMAEKIFETATQKYGIPKEDIFIDVLTMTVSTDPLAAKKTLEALRLVKKNLPVKTILGVGNVSFGLPNREILTAHFLGQAMEIGLDAAILNPGSKEIMKGYFAGKLLSGRDEGAKDYLNFSQNYTEVLITDKKETCQKRESIIEKNYPKDFENEEAKQVFLAILEGRRDEIPEIFEKFLNKTKVDPMEISNKVLIPAMQVVGGRFSTKQYFLPQVLMSAETMQKAFFILQEKFFKHKKAQNKGVIYLATVAGDIHDIGKNIVKTVLESNGFEVKDLGKSVSAEEIVKAVKAGKPDVLGLSALMTTTMPEMKAVIDRLKKEGLRNTVKVMVGGAVVTSDYAQGIGADSYSKDAISAVAEAAKLLK